VVYNGINSSFNPVNEIVKSQTRSKFSQGKEYFLFVGSLHPRKNIIRLLKAFGEFKKETNSDYKLLLAGPQYWGMSDIYKEMEALACKDDILFTNRLSSEDLALVMGSAFALTFVPYFEGFGIPLVEAMQSEIPIITSNVTSLPEIAGDAALMVNPYEVNDIKNAMIKMYNDSALRTSLIAKGNLRKNLFSWDKSADLLWESVTKAINS
jgi:glycosyltransferase involved in cell wall biosynthesis